jgi:hypothetical protein
MNPCTSLPSAFRLRRGLTLALLAGLVGPAAARADEPKADAAPGRAVGKCVTGKASVFRREAFGKPWQIVSQGEELPAGQMLLGTPDAAIESADGAVHLTMMSDLSGLSPFPIVENAVVLRDEPGVDLAFTLDRGRVDVANRKKEGAARVRVHVHKESWDLTLEEPGAQIALELFGRWPRGVHFNPKPGPKDVPTSSLIFLVTRGEVSVKGEGQQHLLKAPPGPALIEWDSVTGMDATPHRLEKLPAWAEQGARDTDQARERRAALGRMRKRVEETSSITGALEELVKSDEPADRRLAVYAMGATDDLHGLGEALKDAKHPDVWDNGVLALRHWLGRGPGQDQRLYRGLMERANFSAIEAETTLQLLHSFGEADLARPETYETLIDYLDHDKFAIRGLAYWHLSRLVPEGKELGYNPADDKDARQVAIKKWRKLIPPGKLPPPRKKAEGK